MVDGPVRPRARPRIGASAVRRRIAAAALALAGIAPSARGQFIVRSWLPWRTIETRHFVFHYPAELEAWTRHVAERADAIDSAVALVAGYAPAAKTNVVVDNPYASANGSAWPFLGQPIINLWAVPPEPRDDIGEFRDWGEMLVSHEFGHIAHLSRPSRNGAFQRLWRALPADVGPVALRSPRWVTEGYATFIEGRVTGSGRPHGVWRPALLRQLALEGQLPRYENLNSSGAFEGGSFAYLVGSAFLEWLADQRGDFSLVQVWRRLSARQNRTFDEAFAGVFGQSAAALYGRFAADVTGKALAARAAMTTAADTGAIVQRLAWYTGDPAISPDGRRVAIVLRSPTRPSRIVVWSTAPEPDTGKARRDSILLARDPLDVPARSIYPPPKRVLASLRARAGAGYDSPRFLDDGRILVTRVTPLGDGSLTPDAYLWDVQRGTTRRVTHGAGVTHADPLPTGRAAIATRCVTGWCDLVSVDLENGVVRTILGGGPGESYDRPRVSPDGTRAAVAVHTNDGWRVAVVDVGSGARAMLAPLAAENAYDAAWLDSTTLVVTSDATGAPQLERVDLRAGERRSLTDATGAAVAGEPNRDDGSVWFLSLSSHGYDLRRTDTRHTAAAGPPLDRALAPATAVAPRPAPTFAIAAPSSPRPFGLSPRLVRWIPAPAIGADGAGGALAITSRDVIGRSGLTLRGAFGEPSTWRGASATGSWAGTRPAIRLDAFGVAQRLTPGGARGGRLDTRLAGGDALADGARLFDTWAIRYRLGVTTGAADVHAVDTSGAWTSRTLAIGEAGLSLLQRGDGATLTEALDVSGAGGRAFDAPVRRGIAALALAFAPRGLPGLSAAASYGRTNADAPGFEQLAIGGGAASLVPAAVLSQRLPMPALPSAVSVGTSAFTYRGSLNSAPLSFYWFGGSTAPGGSPFRRWQRVAGAEWAAAVPAIPLAGTPPARARIGLGESLDPPVRHRVRFYLDVAIDP